MQTEQTQLQYNSHCIHEVIINNEWSMQALENKCFKEPLSLGYRRKHY